MRLARHRAFRSPAGRTLRAPRQRGLSLVELVMAIALIGTAIAGVLTVYQQAVKGSADPLVRKQAVAIAESLLEEALMQPFTWCDPQDAANDAATLPASGADCTGGAAASEDRGGGALGPDAGETRGSATSPLDNVADYHGFAMGSGISGFDGAAVLELAAYSARVDVTRAGSVFGIANDAVLRVEVTVSGRGETIVLTGYRFRHSPNATG